MTEERQKAKGLSRNISDRLEWCVAFTAREIDPHPPFCLLPFAFCLLHFFAPSR
jgi:hypothetical protein